MATFESDLGKVTAYAYAVDAGYQGTEAEFEEELLRAVDTFETDKTLAVEDKAADAKTTGNRIAKLKNDLDQTASYIDETVDDFEDLKNTIFNVINASINIDDIDGITKMSGMTAGLTSATYTGIKMDANASYDTYYLVLNQPVSIAFDNPTVAYLALCIADDYTGTRQSGTSVILLGSNPVRYRKSESNLPTKENPLLVSSGSVIAFTVTANATEQVFGFDTAIAGAKESFADDVLEAGGYVPVTEIGQITLTQTKADTSELIESEQIGYCDITTGRFTANASYTTYKYLFENGGSFSLERLKGGLVGVVIYSEYLETIPTTTTAAQSYFVAGYRSDKSDSQALPTPETPVTVTAGQMIVVFCQEVTLGTDFRLTLQVNANVLNPDIYLGENQIEQVEKAITIKKPLIWYSAGADTSIGANGKEQLTIMLPAKVGYVKYAFVRCESDSKNANVWRIDQCYACDDDLNVRYAITSQGEWEMALRVESAPDFTGGIAHGDEVYDQFDVIIDGKHIDDITALPITEFETIVIKEVTTLYDPNDGATLSTKDQFTPIGTHGRAYIIDADGIRLMQEVTFSRAITLEQSYGTMLPIIRGNDAVSAEQITDHYFANNNYLTYDVSVGASGSAGYGWKENVTMAHIWGNTSGVLASVEMLKQPDINNAGARRFQVQNTVDAYNKLYWSLCGVANNPYTVAVGERFVVDTMYKIDVAI